MKNDTSKGIFTGRVCFNQPVGRFFYRLGVEFSGTPAKAFAAARPGQFVEIDISQITPPPIEAIPQELRDKSKRTVLLRRPFSFSDIQTKGQNTTIEILYQPIGPASLRMTNLSKGQPLNLIGPLGNGFQIPKDKKTALLVIGGMGAGPLIHLAKQLTKEDNIKVNAFIGARSSEWLPLEKIASAAQTFLSTDDGSAGFHGFVTDCFSQWLANSDQAASDVIIYSCGPEVMLAKVAEIARENNIDCQLNMERLMGCGIGLCQSCAVECKQENSNETVYKLCCKDGPVFNSREVVFNL